MIAGCNCSPNPEAKVPERKEIVPRIYGNDATGDGTEMIRQTYDYKSQCKLGEMFLELI